MKQNTGLTLAELLSLDALIAHAQERGISLNERVSKTQEQAEAQEQIHEAMWEARHGGIVVSEGDREIIKQMRELAKNLEIAPTLGQLIELRGEALRQNG